MITFTDLINSGIAPSPYEFDVVTTGSDRFVINYNNIWGVISDTHMGIGEDGNYYITGQLFRDARKTSTFVYAYSWGGYTFSNSSLKIATLHEYCRLNHKALRHVKVNGDDVLKLVDVEDNESQNAVSAPAPKPIDPGVYNFIY